MIRNLIFLQNFMMLKKRLINIRVMVIMKLKNIQIGKKLSKLISFGTKCLLKKHSIDIKLV
jgi:hypothetical protein